MRSARGDNAVCAATGQGAPQAAAHTTQQTAKCEITGKHAWTAIAELDQMFDTLLNA
jgi:hypothetical protein